MSIYLSKSRIMSGLQCPKRLYLQVNPPEEIQEAEESVYDACTEFRFLEGHRTGEAARGLYPDGVLVQHDTELHRAITETGRYLQDRQNNPIFEATFTHDKVLVRADLLFPARNGVRIVEVKASTKVKDQYPQDCAIQAWVIENAGWPVDMVELAHINNRFVYHGNGDYQGLFTHADITTEVRKFMPVVPEWIDMCRKVLSGECPDIEPGDQCSTPYDCPYQEYCNRDKEETEYPLYFLPYGKARAEKLADMGIDDLRDIPEDFCLSEKQRRVVESSMSGEAYQSDELADILRSLEYPRYYLDFETMQFAVPVWKGTSPYKQIPFQWSCHVEHEDGTIEHHEFLDVSGDDPRRGFVESLLNALGDHGPIIVYSPFEKSRLNELTSVFPQYEQGINAVIERLFDLLPVMRDHFYHPDMGGSWSIKRILPVLAPDLDYGSLGSVQDGSAAQLAFSHLLFQNSPEEDRRRIIKDMLRYCQMDTEAMVRIVRYFR